MLCIGIPLTLSRKTERGRKWGIGHTERIRRLEKLTSDITELDTKVISRDKEGNFLTIRWSVH